MSQSYVSSVVDSFNVCNVDIYNNAYNIPQLIVTSLYFYLKQIIVPKKEGQILFKKTCELSTPGNNYW